jgi:hypothetical protein
VCLKWVDVFQNYILGPFRRNLLKWLVIFTEIFNAFGMTECAVKLLFWVWECERNLLKLFQMFALIC